MIFRYDTLCRTSVNQNEQTRHKTQQIEKGWLSIDHKTDIQYGFDSSLRLSDYEKLCFKNPPKKCFKLKHQILKSDQSVW